MQKKPPFEKPIAIRALIAFLRFVYPHRVQGEEHLRQHEDGTMLLVCNHGEIYGPVAAMLFLNARFRPWVLSRMMEMDEIVEHMYYGTMERQKWLPESWKRPLLRAIAPAMCWLFRGVNAIPVYRGKPKDLLKTFRLTLDAMQDGDNILIFPEDADEHEEGKSGFVKGDVSKFYTGFAMIGPMAWAKMRRRAVFVPVYANRKKRLITIGKGIAFDPETPVNEEKLRIAQQLRAVMHEMSQQ